MKQAIKFQLSVDDVDLADLKKRIRNTRWADEVPGNKGEYGTNKSYLRDLVDYWSDTFDWRQQEQLLNSFEQFKTKVMGIDLHFIHEKGSGSNPMPLLLSHGWPGSVFEFHKLIPMLTNPEKYGANPTDSFTVVAPSLPGYCFSFVPDQQRFSCEMIADCFVELMRDHLGFLKFGAQGGDWGSFVTSRIGYLYPELLYGIHLNMLPLRRDPGAIESTTPEEVTYLKQLKEFRKQETGYQWIQGTKPQTLAYSLTDSPTGLAAWIVEKFHSWSDHRGDLNAYLGRDTILTNIMLYWISGCIGASFWPYYARLNGEWPVPMGHKISVPTGYVEFPKEILRPPKSLAKSMYSNITRWAVAERGGHFAALEQPEKLAEEIRDFFRPYR